MTRWATAFDEVILRRLRADAKSVATWKTDSFDEFEKLSHRGHLAANDGWRDAAWGAFRYQRYHADAFRRALELLSYSPKRDRVVFDLGCGAGTVAIAMWELFDDVESAPALSYVGWDHNSHVLDLGAELLSHPAMAVSSRDAAFEHDLRCAVDRVVAHVDQGRSPLITMSYLLCQRALGANDLSRIVDACVTVAQRSPRRVNVVITDAAGWSSSQYGAWRAGVASRVAVEEVESRTFGIRQRYANLDPEWEGWFRTVAPKDNTIECRGLRLVG